MKVIHKFRLANEDAETVLNLKRGFKIIHSEYIVVEKAICIWVEQTLSVDVPCMQVIFKVVKSGDPLPDRLVHVASAVDNFAPEAYHIFQEPVPLGRAASLSFQPEQFSAA